MKNYCFVLLTTGSNTAADSITKKAAFMQPPDLSEKPRQICRDRRDFPTVIGTGFSSFFSLPERETPTNLSGQAGLPDNYRDRLLVPFLSP